MDKLSQSEIDYRLKHYKQLQERLRAIQRYAKAISPGDYCSPMMSYTEFELRSQISRRIQLMAMGHELKQRRGYYEKYDKMLSMQPSS